MTEKITRVEAVNKMKDFYESIPEGASSYHKMDMLLSFMQRNLGVLPPASYTSPGVAYDCEWKDEPEDEENL
jgi:hypothetical protein